MKRTLLENPIAQTISTQDNPYPRSYTGPDSAQTVRFPDCHTNFPKNVTSCLIASLTVQENAHLAACGKNDCWRMDCWSMKEAVFEEIASYRAERDFLKGQIRRLECSCPY